MDVLTEQTLRTRSRAAAPQLLLYFVALAYAVMAGSGVLRHEPWVDEAQSWLLARDAGLVDLWTRLLHYEGTTGLWQTLLHFLIRAGMPYSGMNIFSGLLGLGGACVLAGCAPFPAAVRAVLPFTFYLGYQYAVIARSYDLLPLLLFCCAAIYSRAQRPLLFASLLCLMAAVSVHGMLLAGAAGLSALVHDRDRKRLFPFLAAFAAVAALLAAAAWPARDGTFISGFNLSFEHWIETSGKAFASAFTGDWISSLVLIALTLPWLWRGGGWLFFALSTLLLCTVEALVYSQVWHHGILFLAWVFALWISTDGKAGKESRFWYGLAMASLGLVTVVQCYWTARSLQYDWGHPYSASREAARNLREMHLETKKLYAVGFACTAIQPYFVHNIFANVNNGGPEAYWDWSRRNHVNLDTQHLRDTRPDYVIVGYKNDFERGVWTDLVRNSGYRQIRHFDGNSFWQTQVFEPESYDLFERSASP